MRECVGGRQPSDGRKHVELVVPPYGYCDFNPASIPAPYCEAIGRVSIAWATVEQSVETGLRLMARIDLRTAAIMFAHASLPQRLDQLVALAVEWLEPDVAAKVKALRSRVDALAGLRNDLVHCEWFMQRSTGRVLMRKVRARGALKTELRHYEVPDIVRLATDAHALSLDIFVFFDDIRLAKGLPDETLDK